jgi:acetolactate synthase I/II/III large subunit
MNNPNPDNPPEHTGHTEHTEHTGQVPVGEALVQLAKHHDVRATFGIVSIHNQPLIDALVAADLFVPVRHEASAVNAADAYARVNGGLGIAITSTGTGSGNAAGSLIEALAAGSSVLHVTGQIDAEYLGQGRGVIHETKDQLGMLAAVSKSAYSATNGHAIGPMFVHAADEALTASSGPVSIEIPIDLQYQLTDFAIATNTSANARSTYEPNLDQELLEQVCSLLRASTKPLLWLGGGAVGAGEEIDQLANLLGAGVLSSNAGRGTISEHDDRVIGNFAAHPKCAPLLAEADLLLSIGTHFRSNETKHYKLALPPIHIQIDVEAAALGRSYANTVGLQGDAKAVLQALLMKLDGHYNPEALAWTQKVTDTRQQVRTALRAAIGPYAQLCDAMSTHFAPASPLVRDVTIPASAWGTKLLPVVAPNVNINARGGGIGQGLGMAIGASAARPDVPTLLMVGDGGLAVHLGEMGTLAQQQSWIVMVLFNDGGYGVLRNLQDLHFGRRAGVDLFTPDFAKLCDAYGIAHRMLRSPSDCDAVLAEAIALRRPVVVEVDCDAFGPMPEPFVPPVPVNK